MPNNTRAQNAKSNSARKVNINPKASVNKITADETDGNYKCVCCGTVHTTQRGRFPVSNSVLFAGNNGYVPICRSCLEKYYAQLIDFYSGNEEHALEHICRICDWYYDPSATAMTTNVSAGKSRVSVYPSKINMAQIKSKGTTYLDTIKNQNKNKILSDEDLDAHEAEGTGYVPSKETIKFFGFGYTSEEYEFLDTQYDDWCQRYECKSKSQEEIFKSLCLAQLNIQKAQRNGATKEINDTMKTFQDLLGTANIKPSQSASDALKEQNTFGTFIKMVENERPISAPLPEWADVDGVRSYVDTYLFGHLAKVVHLKNDNEAKYNEEIAKYTVTRPTYEDSDDTESEPSLLDKYSDKGDKGSGET